MTNSLWEHDGSMEYDEVLLKNFFTDLATERDQTLEELMKTLDSSDFDALIGIFEKQINKNESL
jgi:hypothetical protein